MNRIFRILIVDDDEIWINFCFGKLKKLSGCIIEMADSVEKAFERIQSGIYDLIFCDYRMEYKDAKDILRFDGGYRICARAKSYLPHVTVVMVTAYGSADLARDSLVNKKFDDYFEKAIDPKVDIVKIRAKINEAIEEWNEESIAPNPFQAQAGQLPRYMAPRFMDGRSDFQLCVDQLRIAEDGSQARFLILGQMGSGKSCLLNHFKNYCQKRGYYVSGLEIPVDFPIKSSRKTISNFLADIINGFRSIGIVDFGRFAESIKDLGGSVEAFGVKLQLKWERKDASPETLLTQGLKSIVADLQSKSEVVILLLDGIRNDVRLPGILKSLFRILGKNEFTSQGIVIGASVLTRDVVGSRQIPNVDSNLSRFFAGNMLYLPNFSKDQVIDIISEALAGTGVDFDQTVVEKVFRHAKGHPYLTQLLCNRLYNCQIAGKVRESAFKSALQACSIELCSFLRDLFEGIDEDEERLLYLIATSEDGLSVDELQRILLDRRLIHFIPKVPDVCAKMLRCNILIEGDKNRYLVNIC
jgi:CheY-like chemotaxis protein